MALTKSDLAAIRQTVKEEFEPRFQQIENRFDRLDRKIDKIDVKFTKLFNFLDKEFATFRRKTAKYLGIPSSDLSS